ncbi:Lipid storage droplets surface-binding protein 2 [Melipona quadrifasciata]|uniref:Lipid storage droplets surface-binding protein 2 n=1 Tax=Melipona quadrifasciata TaxID=166423 RepID=A0A0M9A1J5_9HYME|nr:Lipid storage droplets surface-binding protein 2 [Melipona quadrifasciata]
MEVGSSKYICKIEAVNRALKIPSVNYLWDKSTEVYGRVKDTNVFVHWAFNTMENLVDTMIEKSLPVAKLIEKPICTLDKTLCQGIDYVEVKLPIIQEEPEQSFVSDCLKPAVETFTNLKKGTKHKVKVIKLHTYYKVHYLRMYSWQQADRVMSTETGISILKTVDKKLCNEDAKLHHTVGRLSEFSSRISKRKEKSKRKCLIQWMVEPSVSFPNCPRRQDNGTQVRGCIYTKGMISEDLRGIVLLVRTPPPGTHTQTSLPVQNTRTASLAQPLSDTLELTR